MKFTIFITEKCNLRCKYCYEKNMNRNKSMNLNVADKTINFILKKISSESLDIPLCIVLHGGEPFINFELIKYIHKRISNKVRDREIIYDITTNGTILDQEKMDFICKNINNISVSIDGTKESHDKNRIFINGKGSYDLAINNAKKLINSGKDVRIRMTYSTNTVHELYDSIFQIAKEGFRNIVTIPDYMDDNWSKGHIKILNDQISMLVKLKKIYPDLDVTLLDVENLNKSKSDCFGGIVNFAIDINGNIFPCIFSVGDENLKIGSVFKNNINKTKQMELFKICSSDNDICKNCLRKEYCDSKRCKFLNKKVMGDFNKPIPIICTLQRVYLKTSRKFKGIYDTNFK